MGFKLGKAFSDVFGSTNKTKAKAPPLDRNAYNYGGTPNGAEDAANGYAQTGANAQQRQGVIENYGNSNEDRGLGMQARQGQAQVAQASLARALGQGPSIAQMQADRQMQQATAAQSSAAASARGAGGLALASQNAANNTATMQSDISNQAQINGANERMQAEQSAAQQFGAMRGGDQAVQGQDAQQSQAQGQLFDAQRARNDQMQQGYDQLGNQVRSTQLAAGMNYGAQTSANSLGAAGINAGVAGQNASMNQANAMNALGSVQSGAGAIFGGSGGAPAAKARGGPVAGRTPYLVGEQGPELVVPQHDGYVLTAEQTRRALGNSPADAVTGLFDRGHSQARGASLASIVGASKQPTDAPRSGNGAGDFIRSLINGPRRESGGPVDRGGAPTSTWGTGLGVDPATTMSGAENEWRAGLAAGLSGATDRERDERLPMSANAMAVPGFSPGIKGGKDDPLRRQDETTSSTTRAKEAQGLDLSDREAYEAQGADYRSGRAKKLDRAGATPPARSLASFLADNGKKDMQAAAAIDTSYHGNGGGYAAPQLIPLPGRAMGGPVSAGGAPMGGLVPMTTASMRGNGVGGGIELGASGGMSHDDLLRAGSGLGDPSLMRGMVGGGGVTGGSSMGGHAIPGGSYGGAREDGGPVDPSKTYLTGERGPEMVVPKNTDRPATTDVKRRAGFQGTLASILSPLAPGAGLFFGAQSVGSHAAGAVLSAEDKAAADRLKAAQDEQAAQDAERAAMNAAERSGPAPAHSAASTVLSLSDSDVEHRIRGDRKPTLAELMSQPAPEPKARDRYTYNPSLPSGERFVSKTREPTSFHRDDPALEKTPRGRGKAPSAYDTKLSPAEERTYQTWKQRVAPNDSGADYDYRGAFKAGATPGEDGHWVDTFKKPNHPTFSVESQYARGADAAKAGRWAGDRFIPPSRSLVAIMSQGGGR